MTKEQIEIILAKAEEIYETPYSINACYYIFTEHATYKVRGSSIQTIFFNARMIVFLQKDNIVFIPFDCIQKIKLCDYKEWRTIVDEQKNA